MVITSMPTDLIAANKNTAAYHNTVPRFKDITSYYTDGTLWRRINGTDGYALFEDIYLGDYFTMNNGAISAYEQTQTYQATGSSVVTVAGFDIMLRNGDTELNKHHIVCVPGQGEGGTQHFGRSRMNTSDTTVGAYKGSEMFTTTIGPVVTTTTTPSYTDSINQQLFNEFGSHLLTTKELLSKTMTADAHNKSGHSASVTEWLGASSDWEWTDCQAVLMSEVEVYGTTVFSSSGFDTGNAKMQLPLFAISRGAMNNRTSWYWLKDVASSAYFCDCGGNGYADCYHAGYANRYVRPRFLLS